MSNIEVGEYCSRKEFIQKYKSEVGYALYIQDYIKKDDYARLNTGKIVKVIGVRENNVNKKAIYYGIYDSDWFDSMAVENFSKNIIDLIEEGDIVEYIDDVESGGEYMKDFIVKNTSLGLKSLQEYLKAYCKVKSIVTHEMIKEMEYRVDE